MHNGNQTLVEGKTYSVERAWCWKNVAVQLEAKPRESRLTYCVRARCVSVSTELVIRSH